MATNQQIIRAVIKAIGDQVIDGEQTCPKCNEVRVFKIHIKKGKMACTVCNEQFEIEEDTYLKIYKQLKTLFGDALIIE